MPRLHLTDLGVQKLSVPGNYWDESLPAFGVRVGKSKKAWVVVPDQRRVTKIIGYYPDLPLAKARTAARRLLANRSRFHFINFGEALDQFLKLQKAKTRPSSYEGTRRHLDRYFRPAFATKSLEDVRTSSVMDIIDGLMKSPSEAEHAFVAVRQFFRWGSTRGYCSNILSGIKPPSKSTPRARVLSNEELAKIWKACDHATALPSVDAALGTTEVAPCRLPASFSIIVQLLILTGMRRTECASLRYEYIKDDTCTLPSSLTTNKREHSFPIGSLATSLLSMPTEKRHGLIFPARGKTDSPFNGWSKSKASLDRITGFSDWTLHDLRRTFATIHASIRTPPHVVECLLNHATGTISGVAAIYNRHSYFDEMREAVVNYEARITAILISP